MNDNDAQIIMQALTILGGIGGSILSVPGKHRRWKISTDDCVCNSVSLVRCCKGLVEWFQEEEEGTLP